MGVGRDGKPTDAYQPGMELHAKYMLFAEGCRGHLGRRLQERFKLRDGVDPQVYGIGLKELWEIKPDKHQQGLVIHTAGWPLAGRYLRRLVLLPHGEQPGGDRLRRRPGLHQSVPGPVRGIPALQDASRDPPVSRRRQAPRVRRARHLRGRPAVAAQARVPRRLPDRRRRGISQRLAHQGQPCRDQVGHARRRGGIRRGQGRTRRRRTGRVSRCVPRELAARRAAPRAQLQAVDEQGSVYRHADGGHRPGRIRRQGAVDAASRPRRPRDAETQDRGRA